MKRKNMVVSIAVYDGCYWHHVKSLEALPRSVNRTLQQELDARTATDRQTGLPVIEAARMEVVVNGSMKTSTTLWR